MSITKLITVHRSIIKASLDWFWRLIITQTVTKALCTKQLFAYALEKLTSIIYSLAWTYLFFGSIRICGKTKECQQLINISLCSSSL